MGAGRMSEAAEQCAEIEDLLGLLGVQANVFRIENPEESKQLEDELRRALNDRRS